MIFTSVHAKVGDIFADGGLTYTVSSESPAEVKVTGSDASLSGDILIPATVTHESTEPWALRFGLITVKLFSQKRRVEAGMLRSHPPV